MRACGIMVAVLGLVVGCDGVSTDKGTLDCEEPDFQATVFTLDEGTATLSGVVLLPDDVPEGRGFEIGLDAGGVYYGGVADDLFAGTATCGDQIPFTLNDLEAGTYTVEAGVQTASGGAGNLEWIGASDAITVGDGETVDGVEVSVEFSAR